jgi:ABC-2 type transport system permease protein
VSEFVQETLALTRRWIRRQRREMGSVVLGLLQPLVWLLLFGNMFDRVAAWRPDAFGTSRYLEFQAAGIVAFTILGNALMGAVPLLFDRETGFLARLLVAPISRLSLLVSRFLYVVAFSLAQSLVILGCTAALGVKVQSGWAGVAGILATGALLCFGFTLLSMALAFVFPGHASFFAVVGFLMTPLLFLSDALMPLAAMPGWLAAVALANPLTHAVGIMRGLIVGHLTAATAAGGVAALLVFDAAMLALAVRVVGRRME